MLPILPAHLLNPKSVSAGLVAATISGGTSLSGDETVIQADGGGRWKIDYAGIDLRGPQKLRLWTAWKPYFSGLRPLLVPVLSLRTAHIPVLGRGRRIASDIHANDDLFPTITQFVNPMVKASVAADAAIRASSVQIEVTQGGALSGGETFGVANRAYEIERVTGRIGNTFSCRINPPLRAPITVDEVIEFNWPVVQVRAALGQDVNPAIAFGRIAETSISFIEDFSEVSA